MKRPDPTPNMGNLENDFQPVVSEEKPSRIKEKLAFWGKLTKGQRTSVVTFLLLLLVLPLGVFAVISPKAIRYAPAKKPVTPVTPPGKDKQKPSKQVSFEKAMLLNGVDSYVSINESESINPRLGYTMEAWIKPTSFEFAGRIISKMSGSDNSTSILVRSEKLYGTDDYVVNYSFGVVNSGNSCSYHTIFQQKQIPADRVDEITSWQHIAGVVQTDGKLDIFVNGKRSTMNFNSITGVCSRDMAIQVGARVLDSNSVDGYFNGVVDEMRISNISRYEENFNVPSEPFQADEYDIVHYHFDGDLDDVSGNNHDGVKNGKIRFVKSDIQ